jgi:hypothetical protein
VQPMYKHFMDPTSPLHWMMRKNHKGKVIVQTKFTVDDLLWSTAYYPWTKNAPRPQDRAFSVKESGLLPSDLVLAESRTCTESRLAEVTAAVNKVRNRLNAEEEAALDEMLERVRVPREHQAISEIILDVSTLTWWTKTTIRSCAATTQSNAVFIYAL